MGTAKAKSYVGIEHSITTDHITGEQTETTTTSSTKRVPEPSYVKIYLQDIEYLNKLPKGTGELIYELIKFLNYDNEIILIARNKKKICESRNIQMGTLNNQLTKLVNEKVLIRLDRGAFKMNTYLFGKGDWQDVMKHRKDLKLDIVYSKKDGRTVTFFDS